MCLAVSVADYLYTYFGGLLNSQDRRPLLCDWLFNGFSRTESATVNLSSEAYEFVLVVGEIQRDIEGFKMAGCGCEGLQIAAFPNMRKRRLASLGNAKQYSQDCGVSTLTVQRTISLAFAATSSHAAMASRLACRISAASTIACHPSGFPARIMRMPASHSVGSPMVRRATRSGQCQLCGPRLAAQPG